MPLWIAEVINEFCWVLLIIWTWVARKTHMDRFVALARTLKRLNYCFSVLASATNRSIVLILTFGLYACPIMKVNICTSLCSHCLSKASLPSPKGTHNGTYVPLCGLIILCWTAAVLEGLLWGIPTPHQQDWANSIQESLSNHLFMTGWWLPDLCGVNHCFAQNTEDQTKALQLSLQFLSQFHGSYSCRVTWQYCTP